jgi:hypothetical protein
MSVLLRDGEGEEPFGLFVDVGKCQPEDGHVRSEQFLRPMLGLRGSVNQWAIAMHVAVVAILWE